MADSLIRSLGAPIVTGIVVEGVDWLGLSPVSLSFFGVGFLCGAASGRAFKRCFMALLGSQPQEVLLRELVRRSLGIIFLGVVCAYVARTIEDSQLMDQGLGYLCRLLMGLLLGFILLSGGENSTRRRRRRRISELTTRLLLWLRPKLSPIAVPR